MHLGPLRCGARSTDAECGASNGPSIVQMDFGNVSYIRWAILVNTRLASHQSKVWDILKQLFCPLSDTGNRETKIPTLHCPIFCRGYTPI